MSLSRLAYYLALIGGVILLAFGILDLVVTTFHGFYTGWGFGFGGILSIIAGLIAIIGASRAADLVWAIILIIIGLIAGGLGGLLVLIGGIIGLVAAVSHRS